MQAKDGMDFSYHRGTIVTILLFFSITYTIITYPRNKEESSSTNTKTEVYNIKKKFPFYQKKYDEPCTDCWCLPEDGPDGQCPPLENRRLNYTKKDRIHFKSFNLTLTPYDDLPHLYPEGETSTPDHPKNDDPICTPYPDLQKKLKLPSCEKPIDYGNDAACAFFYNDNDDNYCINRNYGMKTYKSWDDAIKDKSIVTHLGACGVCSNANDLAINLRPDLTDKSYECGYLYWNTNLCYDCYLNLGFTPDCAWLWTTNTIHTAKYCKLICLEDAGKPINDPNTCILNDCFMCDENKSGPIFVEFGGRTRRGSGIITDIVRECDDIANILQDPCATNTTNNTTALNFEKDNNKLFSIQ